MDEVFRKIIDLVLWAKIEVKITSLLIYHKKQNEAGYTVYT